MLNEACSLRLVGPGDLDCCSLPREQAHEVATAMGFTTDTDPVITGGPIGPDRREIEVEPWPQSEPVREPSPELEPEPQR